MRTAVPIPGSLQVLTDVNSAGVAVGSSADPDTFESLTRGSTAMGGCGRCPAG